jgi:uncharacterized YigZ family protein
MSDAARYAIPAAEHRVEQTIQRSRFVATVGPAATTDEAAAFVRRVAALHADATHNCWAFLVGRPGSTDRVGMSDDGEPHGTAGRPMLNVLVHANVGDVAAVVTRYYGGTKLGTGGLVRAYGGTLQLAVSGMPLAERIAYAEVTAVVEYAHVSALKAMLAELEADPLAEEYGAEAVFRLRMPAARVAGFRRALADATRGRATVDES